jgi:uncharacterized protein (DUF2342 family)
MADIKDPNSEFLPALAELKSQLNSLKTDVPMDDPNYQSKLREVEREKTKLLSRISELEKKAIDQARQTEAQTRDKIDKLSKIMT